MSSNRRLLHAAVLVLSVLAFAATASAATSVPMDRDALVASSMEGPEVGAEPSMPPATAPDVEVPPAPVAPAAAPAPAPIAHPWIAMAQPSEPAAQGSSDDEGWSGSFQLYGFLSGFDGELRGRNIIVEPDESFGDITDILKFAVGMRLEAQHGKWGFAFDNNYVHIGDDVETPERIVPDYRYDVALNVTEIEGTYRLYSTGSQDDPVGGPKFAIDALGGMRIVHLSTDIELRRLIFPDAVRDASSTYVHGYLGNRFIASPSKYVALIGRYNLSLASDLSWFINGTVEIRPWEHFAFGAGLQVLDLSIEKDSADTAVDARFFGPVLYLKFHF